MVAVEAHQVFRPGIAVQLVLDGVLDLLLQLVGDVAAVRNVTDARQRCRCRVRLCEGWQPAYNML